MHRTSVNVKAIHTHAKYVYKFLSLHVVNTILSFDKTNYTTEEGQTLPVVISLNYPVLFDFSVTATAVNQTAYCRFNNILSLIVTLYHCV